VIDVRDPAERLAWLADHVQELPGTGVIYTLTKHDAERVAEWLVKCGVNAIAYHSEIDPRHTGQREELENKLLNNEVKVMVATTALGMGFDKPDLGFVIHYQMPGSVVHYYQQVGRAGRALDEAYGILFHGEEDNDILDYFIRTALPPETHIEEVLSALSKSAEGLTQTELEREVNMSVGDLKKVLTNLCVESPQPIQRVEGRWLRTPAPCSLNPDKVERLKGIRIREREQMRRYMESRQCLMAFLVSELNDADTATCGQCAVCQGKPVVPLEISNAALMQAQRFLSRLEMTLAPRKRAPAGSLAEFGIEGTVIPEEIRCETGRVLCRWGDPGLGKLVIDGKYHTGRFDNQLIQASAEMIEGRWRPEPFPQWGTCVPSLRTPRLVPEFAERLCHRLGIPFVLVLQKIKETRPQKEMENSYHQVANICGAFEVKDLKGYKDRPVLLIDDMIDSGWTLTLAGMALRRAGAGAVYPFALGRTTKGDRT
jgi:ATP-dependent DNA helicase RecQ